MKKILASVEINCSKENVWLAVTDINNYKKWAEVFSKGSYFEGDWEKGSTTRFLVKNKQGETEGMVSEIAEALRPSFISIKHVGYVYNGVDDTTSDDILAWAPAYENYTIEGVKENLTRLSIEAETLDEYYDLFLDLWPKALHALKETAERISDISYAINY